SETGGTRAATGDQSPGTPGLYGHGRACRVIASGRLLSASSVIGLPCVPKQRQSLKGSGVSTRSQLFRRNWVESGVILSGVSTISSCYKAREIERPLKAMECENFFSDSDAGHRCRGQSRISS